MWVVRADSKFQNAQSVIDAVKRDPVSISFGVGTVPSDDQFNILRPLRASGVDISTLKLAAFRSGGDLMTNLLGEHVDVVSASYSEAEGQAAAGRVRMLATASAVRMAGAIGGSVPTWRELGLDVAVTHWRGVFGPPGMSRRCASTPPGRGDTRRIGSGRLRRLPRRRPHLRSCY